MNILLLIKLLLAHVLTDFIFQPDKLDRGKAEKILKTKYFGYHIHSFPIKLFNCRRIWSNWQIPIAIFLSWAN